MSSIVKDRRRAAELIREHYPPAQQPEALAALGDAALVDSAPALFALRCKARCLEGYANGLGAPVETHQQGEEVALRTTRGGEFVMYRGSDTWWGIVWHTKELARERDRAAAERRQVEKNAQLYAKQRALQ